MPGERLALARLADVPTAVEIMPEAQRMLDEADERWTAEHGLLADNPLLDEIHHAAERLRENPQVGILVRSGRFRSEVRRLAARPLVVAMIEPTLLEAIALWHQAPVRAVVSARDVASWSALGLADALDGGVTAAHYTVEMRAPVRERGQRIRGLGSFADSQQLDVAGLR